MRAQYVCRHNTDKANSNNKWLKGEQMTCSYPQLPNKEVNR